MSRRKLLAAALAASWAMVAGGSVGFANGPFGTRHCDSCENCSSGTHCDAMPHGTSGYYTSPGNAYDSYNALPYSSADGDASAGQMFDGQPATDGGIASAPSASDFAGAGIPQPGANSLAFASPSAMNTIGGYIDDALVRTRFRMRYDTVDGGNSDRAEFLYATYPTAATPDGPNQLDIGRLDYEEFATYFEYAMTERFSAFIDVGIRFNEVDLHPGFVVGTGDTQAEGFSDMAAGFKYALINCPEEVVTFQFKTLIPTGDEENALGTGHVSLMPGILFQQQLSQRLTFFGELHDWIALGATEIEDGSGERMGGNVLRYGLGAGYDLYQCGRGCNEERLTAVTEVVGWTVLDGHGFRPSNIDGAVGGGIGIDDGPFNMAGDTIVNIKVGTRYTSGRNSLYVGYGFAVTDDVWYDDIIRFQYERFLW